MSTSRETVRDALVALLSTALVGVGLPAKTVTGSKVEKLAGLTPLVSVLSTGSWRETLSFQGMKASFQLEIQAWVLQEATGWTNAQAEDALDSIESIVAGVIETSRGTDTWSVIEYSAPTMVIDMAVTGTPFFMERMPITVRLAHN